MSTVLDAVRHLSDGREVVVEGDVLDTVRRLKDGDPTLGWEGDPTMELFVDLGSGLFDVWALDAQGEPYLAVAGAPTCGPEMIRRVVAGDTRHNDVVGRAMKAQQKALDAAAAAQREKAEEVADRLHFALRQDIGHLYGAPRRRFVSVDGLRDV